MSTDERRGTASIFAAAGRRAAFLTCSIVIAFGLGLAGRWWWIADLFSHFRVQYAVLLWLCGAVLVWSQRYRLAAVAFIAAAGMTASVLMYVGWSWKSGPRSDESIRLVTFNKYWQNADVVRIGSFLESSGADVVALQEMESHHAVQALAAHLPSFKHIHTTQDMPLGAVIFSRWPILQAETIELVPGGGTRVAKATVDWDGRPVTVIGAHLHWPIGADNVKRRNAELIEIARLARNITGPLLIGGDFNVTTWSTNFWPAVGSGLKDCARGRGLVTTWPTQFAPLAIRIDHCLHSSHWQPVNVQRGPNLGSDHYPTVNDLVMREGDEGR